MPSQKPHPLYTRDGDNLTMTLDLSLKEALTGWKRTVTTIDGRNIAIEKAGPTQPNSCDEYPDLGMPNSRAPQNRGKFIVRYNVRFPDQLSVEQKRVLKEVLP